MAEKIVIKGAREHNLKDIDLEIPRNKLVVITGLSGSGKSSLAFDTLYAEGQRRYVESLSSYARQFLGLMEKPDVDQIDGLSPAISIDQKSTSRNPRSTVATVTEIYDYLRLLFARIGVPHCPARLPDGQVCGKTVARQSSKQIVDEIRKALPKGAKLMILAPIVTDKKGEYEHISAEFTRRGFVRARVDGVVYALDEWPRLNKQIKHTIEIVVDRLVNDEHSRQRLAESAEQALAVSEGVVRVANVEDKSEQLYSEKYACVDHPDIFIPELEPRIFSFNSPHGACMSCSGLGSKPEVDPELIIPNRRLSLAEGAIRAWARTNLDTWWMKKLAAVGEKHGFSINEPLSNLTEPQIETILYGSGRDKYWVELANGRGFEATYEGVVPNLERRYQETESEFMRREIARFMVEQPCQTCHGKRLKPEVLAVTIHGHSIMDICEASITQAAELFENLKLSEREQTIARQILKEIKARLSFLVDVGLNYLTLARTATTLSGGEAQRIRLATQIGSGLTGVLYILDEPSIGLHQRDNRRLINTLKKLRDLDNTVIVVEHDEETMRSADYLIDIGPGAGIHGGEVIATGKPEAVARARASLTGQFLSGKQMIKTPARRREGNGHELVVKGAREHNLKQIDATIPLGKLVLITGVSGSGKSTLINDILAKSLLHELHRTNVVPGRHDDITGTEHLDKCIVIDQSPIGRTPRSNPATYTGMFTPIRELFARTPEAKIRGYKAGRFSFNVKGGRCETCAGDGLIKIEMHFLPDVYVTCEECKGQRYNREALEIHYKGHTISDVLKMTVEQSLEVFANIPSVANKLRTLSSVGLGYINLGQSATTLSGGEAQRVKLATELSRRSTGRTLYVLDEPTTGLHFADVQKLLDVLGALVDSGNTVVVIEHNLDVIKSADHIIDLGPEGGEEGGQVIAAGTPEAIVKTPASYTGKYLRRVL